MPLFQASVRLQIHVDIAIVLANSMPLFQASVRLQIHVDIAIVLANSMPLFQASVRLQLEGHKKTGLNCILLFLL